MLRVYFDDELIDVEAYTELDNEYKLFTDTFKLGSVASNTFKSMPSPTEKLSILTDNAKNSVPIIVRGLFFTLSIKKFINISIDSIKNTKNSTYLGFIMVYVNNKLPT